MHMPVGGPCGTIGAIPQMWSVDSSRRLVVQSAVCSDRLLRPAAKTGPDESWGRGTNREAGYTDRTALNARYHTRKAVDCKAEGAPVAHGWRAWLVWRFQPGRGRKGGTTHAKSSEIRRLLRVLLVFNPRIMRISAMRNEIIRENLRIKPSGQVLLPRLWDRRNVLKPGARHRL